MPVEASFSGITGFRRAVPDRVAAGAGVGLPGQALVGGLAGQRGQVPDGIRLITGRVAQRRGLAPSTLVVVRAVTGRPMWMGKLVPDVHRELQRVNVLGDVVAIELSIQGTFLGPFETPAGVMPTGAKLHVPCGDFWYVRDGKIQEFNCYVSIN